MILAAWADLAGTCVIFSFSWIFRNASLYDPYWSVAPVFIVVYWAMHPITPDVDCVRPVLAVALVTVWAVRLTWNWLRRWQGLTDEDWRYRNLRRKTGRWYNLVNLAGIHLFPTVQVFLGCLALYPALSAGTTGFTFLDALAIAVAGGAICVEALSDMQLHRFLYAAATKGSRNAADGRFPTASLPGLFPLGLPAHPSLLTQSRER